MKEKSPGRPKMEATDRNIQTVPKYYDQQKQGAVVLERIMDEKEKMHILHFANKIFDGKLHKLSVA